MIFAFNGTSPVTTRAIPSHRRRHPLFSPVLTLPGGGGPRPDAVGAGTVGAGIDGIVFLPGGGGPRGPVLR